MARPALDRAELGWRTRANRAAFALKTRAVMRRARASATALAEAERLPADVLRERGRERTMRLARYAFDRTDYYHDLYTAAGFSRQDLEVVDNLEALPALTKAAVREHGDRIRVRDLPQRRFLASVTGGSTGSPLVVYNDALAPSAAMWWRVYRWWGIDPGDDMAFVYRQKHEGWEAVKEYATWWPTRHLLLDARDMHDEAVESFLDECAKVRPRLLVGYVEGVAALAMRLKDESARLTPPHAISVTSSILHAGQRQLIESVLGAPVYDTYRSAEVPWIAAECSARHGLHVQADIRHVETVDDSGRAVEPGETGNVLVSDLTNRVFPLVRYAIGDRSSLLPGGCPCGMGLPRMGAIEGRVADVLQSPSGRQLSGGFGGLFNKWPTAVQQFQIYQARDHAVQLRYVPGPDPKRALRAVDEVCAVLRRLLHDEVEVSALAVPTIEHIGGKARLVHSEVTASPGA